MGRGWIWSVLIKTHVSSQSKPFCVLRQISCTNETLTWDRLTLHVFLILTFIFSAPRGHFLRSRISCLSLTDIPFIPRHVIPSESTWVFIVRGASLPGVFNLEAVTERALFKEALKLDLLIRDGAEWYVYLSLKKSFKHRSPKVQAQTSPTRCFFFFSCLLCFQWKPVDRKATLNNQHALQVVTGPWGTFQT